MKKVAQQPDITGRTVPYRVLRTVPVTFLREPVWVVSPDTKVLGVLKVKLWMFLLSIFRTVDVCHITHYQICYLTTRYKPSLYDL